MSARVEVRGAVRAFGGVRALAGVDLDLPAGEVVGLLGHNGAGKSTLVRALSGVDPLDAGEIRIDGRPVRLDSPREARGLGIETLHQDLALADPLDAVANLFLGRERTHWLGRLDEEAMEREAREVFERVAPGFDVLRTPVRHLSGGQRQAVAIARALCFEARVLVMDEPTAALGPRETAMVGELVTRLRDQGLAILLVSHDLADVLALADRVVVMHTGRVVARAATRETHRDQVLAWMIAGDGDAAG